jgi:hypothetical protein
MINNRVKDKKHGLEVLIIKVVMIKDKNMVKENSNGPMGQNLLELSILIT